ncbi:MAG: cyclase [Halioglobus sp.]|jgi:cyclase
MVISTSKRAVGCSIVALMLTLSFSTMAEEEKELSVTVSPIKGTLYMLQGKGGNVLASVGDDGLLLIDDDYTEYAPAYERALLEIAPQESAPKFLLNTHWHPDHTGGNAYWSEKGTVIVAHKNVLRRMSTKQNIKALSWVVEASPSAALPVVTFESGLALHFNGDDVEVQHFPAGHTDGDSVVFFSKANVVHMGDHFFNGTFPFVDISSGGSVTGYAANVKMILDRIDDETIVIPGHGSIANKADLKRFLQMIETTSADIRSKLDQGMSADAIVEAGLGEQWGQWGGGFITEATWISFVAAS